MGDEEDAGKRFRALLRRPAREGPDRRGDRGAARSPCALNPLEREARADPRQGRAGERATSTARASILDARQRRRRSGAAAGARRDRAAVRASSSSAREHSAAAARARPGRGATPSSSSAGRSSESNPEAAFVCVDAAVDAAIAASEFDEAAAMLQEFVDARAGADPGAAQARRGLRRRRPRERRCTRRRRS